jgi:hypothetical protein
MHQSIGSARGCRRKSTNAGSLLRAVLTLGLWFASGAMAQGPAIVSGARMGSPSVRLTPTSNAAAVAQALRIRAPGDRVLFVTGFGSTLFSHPADRLFPRGNTGRKATPIGSRGPWIDNGQRVVSEWMGTVTKALHGMGVGVDAVIVDQAVGIRSNHTTPAMAAVIQQQDRWPRLAATHGLALPVAGPAISPSTAAAWDRAAYIIAHDAIRSSIVAAIASRWPSAQIHEAIAAPDEPSGWQRSGPATDCLQEIGRSPRTGSALDRMRQGLRDAARQDSASARAQVPWVAGSAEFGDPKLWTELLTHLCLRHGGTIVVGNANGAVPHADRQGAFAAAGRARTASDGIPSVGRTVTARSANPASGIAEATCIEGAGRFLWRLTFPTGVPEGISFASGDPSALSVEVDNDGIGAWVAGPSTTPLQLDAQGMPAFTTRTADPSPGPLLLVNSGTAPAPALARASASEYVIIYQDIQPGSRGTINIDIDLLVAEARRRCASSGAKWGVIDWEDPHFRIINAGPSDPDYHRAVENMARAVAAVRAAVPNVKWTIWGGLELPFWSHDRNWATMPESLQAELVENAVRNWSPLMSQCDWIMPWAYDMYDERIVASWFKESLPRAAAAWLRAKVGAARSYMQRAGRTIPVVVCVCPYFAPGGSASAGAPIPADQLLNEQVRPTFAVEADGIAIWSPNDWFASVIALDAQALNQSQLAAKSMVQGLVGIAVGSMNWSAPDAGSIARDRLNAVIAAMLELCDSESRRLRIVTACD